MSQTDKYKEMGVEADKGVVEEIFKTIVSNDFPHAFINIVRDPTAPGFVKSKKADGDGSKPVYRCIFFFEKKDPAIFQGGAHDAFAMPLGDICASGLYHDLEITDTIAINLLNVPKEIILEELKKGMSWLLNLYRSYGFRITHFGGETADLPIQTGSFIMDVDVRGRAPEVYGIYGNVQPGDAIFGFASDGKAAWEEKERSPIMSNGLTLAARIILHADYAKAYPFLTHPTKPYQGRFRFGEVIPGVGMTVEDALLSPTRQFPILFKLLIEKLKERHALHLLHGITLNSGGGATKILRLGDRIRYVKTMPDQPAFFSFIQEEGRVPGREMYKDFNNGVGSDIIGSYGGGILESVLREVSEETQVKLFFLGDCERAEEENEVILRTDKETFTYKKSEME